MRPRSGVSVCPQAHRAPAAQTIAHIDGSRHNIMGMELRGSPVFCQIEAVVILDCILFINI